MKTVHCGKCSNTGPYCTHSYHIQTLQDNIALFTLEILDEINQIVVNAGHQLVKKKEERICVRADSFVVKTNAHFPTDINLLRDAVHKDDRVGSLPVVRAAGKPVATEQLLAGSAQKAFSQSS